MQPPFRPSDIGSLVSVDEVRLSPDGATVAFTVTTLDIDANAYRRIVWLGPTDGSRRPSPFTAGSKGDGRPRFSPDGRWLAFTSHRGEGDDARSTLHVAPVEGGGEVRQVAAQPEEISDLEWSPDGRWLAFGARIRDEERAGKEPKDQPPRRLTTLYTRLDNIGWVLDRPRQLFVVPADGTGAARQVTQGDREVSGLAWSSDSRRLFFSSARHDGWDLDRFKDLWSIGIAGEEEPQRITRTEWVCGIPSASPDDSLLACTLGRPREIDETQVGVVDPSTGEGRVLTTKLDRNVMTSAARTIPWTSDTSMLVTVEDRGRVHLHELDVDSTCRPVVGGDRCVAAYDVGGGLVAAAVTDAVTAAEIVVADLAGGGERTLFAFDLPVELSNPVRFTAPSADGVEIDAWYYPPVGVDAGIAHPALVNIHGGPATQYGDRLFDEFQFQAGAGYGVIACNPRGSSGRGRSWQRAILWPEHPDDPGSGWGGVDAADILAVVEEACRRFPSIDRDRLGVLGGSYGGYMTTWLIGHSAMFKAACSERAANDLLALELGASDIAGYFRAYSGVTAIENPDAFRRHSATTYAADIHTPLLIIHSEGDLRCPIDQADALFVTLRSLDRDVEYLRFPAESHELSRSGAPKHRIQRAEAILDWFDRWLKEPTP